MGQFSLVTPNTVIEKTINSIKEMGESEAIQILTHIDADGLTSAAIMAKLLHSMDKPFIIRPINQIRVDILKEINEAAEPSEMIILDMGSSEIGNIVKNFPKLEKLVIIDHHIPKKGAVPDMKAEFFFFNPWLFGYDGTTEISSSGLAYLVAKPFIKYFPHLKELAKIAIVGALGDNQDIGEHASLIGINRLIVEDGKKFGVVSELIDLVMYGRESKPLYRVIAGMYDPELPGITGNEEAAIDFLKQAGIIKSDEDLEKPLAKLSEEEKRFLVDELVSRLVFAYSDKFTVDQIKNKLLGYIYKFHGEESGPTRDGREFAGLLNACGKLNKPEIGLAVAIGDRSKFYKQALALFDSYQQVLSDIYKKIWNNLEVRNNLIILNAKDWLDENLTSTVSSIISFSKRVKNEGIIIVIGKSTNNYLKVSFRATKGFREKINLKELVTIMRAKLEGVYGGGHSVAEGAYVPEEKLGEFIEKLSELVNLISKR